MLLLMPVGGYRTQGKYDQRQPDKAETNQLIDVKSLVKHKQGQQELQTGIDIHHESNHGQAQFFRRRGETLSSCGL